MIQELAQHLHNKSIGVLGTSVFYGKMPGIDQDFTILIRDTGGVKPNVDIHDIKSPTFQIFIRSKNYAIGKAKLTTIRELLHGVINEYLIPSGIYYRKIQANAEGGHIGTNDNGQDEFSINFSAEVIE